MKVQERFGALMLGLRYLAFVALLAVTGVAFGWRVPVGVGFLFVGLWLRIRIDARWPKGLHPKKVVVALDLVASGLLGGIIGGLLVGGVFGLIGAGMGVAISIATVPLSTRNEQGSRVPLTLQSSPATAKSLTIIGFLLPVGLLAVCLVLLFAH